MQTKPSVPLSAEREREIRDSAYRVLEHADYYPHSLVKMAERVADLLTALTRLRQPTSGMHENEERVIEIRRLARILPAVTQKETIERIATDIFNEAGKIFGLSQSVAAPTSGPVSIFPTEHGLAAAQITTSTGAAQPTERDGAQPQKKTQQGGGK